MSTGKLYIGRRVREVREAAKLTQTAFAERLGISVSYINQIENNQRSVSASVLVLLAERFGIDLSSISTNDGDRLIAILSEALADPVFSPHSPSLQELKLVVQNAPSFAQALLSCHQAYRRNSEQLASLDDHIGGWSTEPTPMRRFATSFTSPTTMFTISTSQPRVWRLSSTSPTATQTQRSRSIWRTNTAC